MAMSTDRTADVIPIRASESALIRRMKVGDRSAFVAVIAEHQKVILGYCAGFLEDVSVASDLTQEVFLTLWRARGSYEDRGRLRSYLLSVARNRCLAELKREQARDRLAEAVRQVRPATPVTPARSIERREAQAKLESALKQIDPQRAELLRLRFVHEFTPSEIADVLGLKLGTVKSRIHRGLEDLKKELAHDQ